MTRTFLILLLPPFLAAPVVCHGANVGLNFAVPGSGTAEPLFDSVGGVNDESGAPDGVDQSTPPRQRWWNDALGGPSNGVGALTNLQDSSGLATTIDADWAGSDVADSTGWAGGTSDSRMYNGALIGSLGGPILVSFSEIPSSISSLGYDIYVYADFDGAFLSEDIGLYASPSSGTPLEGPVGVADIQEGTAGNQDVNHAPVSEYDLAYRTNSGANDLMGNYVVFEDRTEPSFTIRVDSPGQTAAYVSAIQIVPNVIPEPAMATLAAIAVAGGAWRRR